MFNVISRRVLLGFFCAIAILFFGTNAPVAAQGCTFTDPASGRVITIPCPPQPKPEPPQQGQGQGQSGPDVQQLNPPKVIEVGCITKPTIDFFIATPNPPTGVSLEWKVSNAKSVDFSVKKTGESFGGVASLTGKQDVKFNVQNDTVVATLHAICSPFDEVASLTVSGSEWTQIPKEPDCTNKPIIKYFNVSPASVNLGDSVMFDWSVSNASWVGLTSSKTISGMPSFPGAFDPSSPQHSGIEPLLYEPGLESITYLLAATCGSYDADATALIKVNAPSSAQPQNPPAQPAQPQQPPAQNPAQQPPQPQQPPAQPQSQLPLPKVTDPKVFLNEFMPKPQAGAEYIELYNPTNLPVDISGWQLKHAVGNSAQGYIIPANTMLASRAFKLFPQSETKIDLSDKVGAVQLLTPDNQLADEKSYEGPQFDQAQSRSVDGGGVWTTECAATPNAANCQTTSAQPPSSSAATSTSENILPFVLGIGGAMVALALFAALVYGMTRKK